MIPAKYSAVRPFSDGLAAVVTRKFTSADIQREVHACVLNLVDPFTDEICTQCNLIQLSGKRRLLVSSIAPCGRNGNKTFGNIVSAGGYAALASWPRPHELELRGQPTGAGPGPVYGKVKVLKLIPAVNLAVYQPPASLTLDGIKVSTDVPAPTDSFYDIVSSAE